MLSGCSASFIICSVIALISCDANQLYKEENCIAMTPAKETEIQTIVSEIGDYLNKIARVHEEFDIRLVKIDIEGHKVVEEDKDTKIEVMVNDCKKKSHERKSIGDGADGNKARQNYDNGASENGMRNPKPPVEVFQLNLEENGRELLSLMEKSRRRKYRPLVVYVQEKNGGNRKEYTLLN